MAERLGEAVLELKTDDSDLNRGLDRAEGTARGRLGTISTLAIGSSVAVAGIGAASIFAAANFEQAMDQVGAVAGATKQEMAGLSEEALRIGRETSFGAGEAAQAMEILAANGISAADIMGGAARAAVDLAAAGGTDLATAADLASTAMTVWGLETSDLTDVVNRMAGAANVSRFGVEDMALAVAQGGGAAMAAGVEFGDFTTAIAAIAPSFSSGSDAGTSFKTFLVGLGGTSETAKDAMRELGLITADGSNQFYDAAGNMKSMEEVAGILHGALGPLTEQERLHALQTIFGTDAMRAAGAMANLTSQEFFEMDEAMRETDAAAIAEQRMSNLKGAFEELKGTVEVLMITFGTHFLPVLTSVSLFLATNLPGGIAATAAAFETVFGPLMLVIDKLDLAKPLLIAMGIAIASVLLPAIIAWTAGIVANTVALVASAVAFYAAYAPLIAVALAIGLLVGGIYLLIQHWDQVTAAVQWFIDKVMEVPVVGEIITAVMEIVKGQIADVIEFFRGIIEVGQEIISFFQNIFSGDWEAAWQDLKDIAVALLGTFVDFLALGFIDDIAAALAGLIPWNYVKEEFEDLKTKAFALLTSIPTWVRDHWVDLLRVAVGIIAPWVWVTVAFIKFRDEIFGVLATVVGFFIDLPGRIIDGVGDLLSLLLPKGRDLIAGLWNGAVEWSDNHFEPWLRALPGRTLDFIGDVLGTLWQKGLDLLAGLARGVADGGPALLEWFLGLPGKIIGAIPDALAMLYEIGVSIVLGLWSGISNTWTNFVDWLWEKIKDLPSILLEFFGIGSPSRLMMEIGRDITAGLQIGIEQGRAGVKAAGVDVAVGFVQGIEQGINSNLARVERTGADVVRRLFAGIGSEQRTIEEFTSGIVESLRSAVDGLFSELGRLMNLPTRESAEEDLRLAELRLEAFRLQEKAALEAAAREKALAELRDEVAAQEELLAQQQEARDTQLADLRTQLAEAEEAQDERRIFLLTDQIRALEESELPAQTRIDQLNAEITATENSFGPAERRLQQIAREIEIVKALAEERKLERDVLEARARAADETLQTDYEVNKALIEQVGLVGSLTGDLSKMTSGLWTSVIPAMNAWNDILEQVATTITGVINLAAQMVGGPAAPVLPPGGTSPGTPPPNPYDALVGGLTGSSLNARLGRALSMLPGGALAHFLTEVARLGSSSATQGSQHDIATVLSQMFNLSGPYGMIYQLFMEHAKLQGIGFRHEDLSGMYALEGGSALIPREMLARLHPGEMVMPARLADFIRSAFDSGAGRNADERPITIEQHYHVEDPAPATVERRIRQASLRMGEELALELIGR